VPRSTGQSRKASALLRGTEGSNPSSSIGESIANLTSSPWRVNVGLARGMRKLTQIGPTDHHEEEVHRIDTGEGVLLVDVLEDGVPPRFHIRFEGH
jgi:hypothetical protein